MATNQIDMKLNMTELKSSGLSSIDFYKSITNVLPDHIAVINRHGEILFNNKSWQKFGEKNGVPRDFQWQNYNYFDVCSSAARSGESYGTRTKNGLKQVIDGQKDSFYIEYPCHSPDTKRWFSMEVVPFTYEKKDLYLITHHDITVSKVSEERLFNLTKLDPLTNIANRRAFNEFLLHQWKHCQRTKQYLTLAMIDIDFFKLLNDTYGHHKGDECLQKVGATLKKVTNRPDDLCARIGGEEFVIVFGNTTSEQCVHVIDKLYEKILELNIENKHSPIAPRLTISTGISCMIPGKDNSLDKLIADADDELYTAKRSGRNQISLKPA